MSSREERKSAEAKAKERQLVAEAEQYLRAITEPWVSAEKWDDAVVWGTVDGPGFWYPNKEGLPPQPQWQRYWWPR